MAPSAPRPPDFNPDKSRLISLSDGVFAFALTLLVINLKLPDAATVARVGLARAVLEQSQALLTWLLSFFIIGLYWLGHHRIFVSLKGHDRRLMLLNLLFLLCISFIWYPTALLGTYGSTQFAVVFYDGSLILTSLVLMAVWAYAAHDPRLFDRDASASSYREGQLRTFGTVGVGLLSIAVSFVSVGWAERCWLLVAVHRVGVGRLAGVKRWVPKRG